MRVSSVLRVALISPEVVALLLPFALMPHAAFLDDLAFILKDRKFELFAAAAYPFAVLIYGIGQASSIISPSGKRSVLLDWSEYDVLKTTIYVAIALILVSFAVSLYGYVKFIVDGERLGLVAICAGAVSSSVSAFTLILAYWRSREIIGE